MLCTSRDLDNFIVTSDALGGPGSAGCNDYWAGFTYQPEWKVDQSLDPFSDAYVAEQMKLYEEISGRTYQVRQHEMTEINIEKHIAAVNPYDHPDPAVLALHLERLSRALRQARPRRGDVLLDMGCGWGLSSELAAYLGLSVIAVDVNPSFIRLVQARAINGRRLISTLVATFEDVVPPVPVDIALFYESLHHAVRPWVVAARIAANLKPGGRMVLAAEPINDIWWMHWGMRLDPMSVYCIRKFGWFESGWSIAFIQQALHRAGLAPRADLSPDMGYVIVAEKNPHHRVSGDIIAQMFENTGGLIDDTSLIFAGKASLKLIFPTGASSAVLNIANCRGRSLKTSITCNNNVLWRDILPPGESSIAVPFNGQSANIQLEVEQWVPDDELSNGDRRVIGLHLRSIDFNPEHRG